MSQKVQLGTTCVNLLIFATLFCVSTKCRLCIVRVGNVPHRKESNAAKFLKSLPTKVPVGDDEDFEDKEDFEEDDSDIQ